MPYLIFLVICAIWGASFILMKKAALSFGPVGIGALRVLGGAIVAGMLWRWRGTGARLRREHWLPMVAVVAVGYAWPYSIQPWLVARHGSGFIGMTVSLVPLLTLAVMPWMLGISPTRRQVIGVVGGLICMVVLFGDGLDRNVPPFDLLLAGSVPLCYAVTNTYIRQRFVGVSPLSLTTAALSLSAAMLLPIALLMPGEAPRINQHLGLAVFSIFTLGVLGTGLSTFLFNKLIQEQGPLFAGMTTYVVPVGAIAWGWLDHERVTAMQLAALLGIFAMVALVQYRAARKAPNSQSPNPKE
jgi:drug/metabolite transporter (DMT)-like permease